MDKQISSVSLIVFKDKLVIQAFCIIRWTAEVARICIKLGNNILKFWSLLIILLRELVSKISIYLSFKAGVPQPCCTLDSSEDFCKPWLLGLPHEEIWFIDLRSGSGGFVTDYGLMLGNLLLRSCWCGLEAPAKFLQDFTIRRSMYSSLNF